jgi:hypothetical protein
VRFRWAPARALVTLRFAALTCFCVAIYVLSSASEDPLSTSAFSIFDRLWVPLERMRTLGWWAA